MTGVTRHFFNATAAAVTTVPLSENVGFPNGRTSGLQVVVPGVMESWLLVRFKSVLGAWMATQPCMASTSNVLPSNQAVRTPGSTCTQGPSGRRPVK